MRGLSLSFICWNSFLPIERFQWLARLQQKSGKAQLLRTSSSCHPRRGELTATKARPEQLCNFGKTQFGAVPEPRDRQLLAHFRKSETQVGAFGKKMSVRQKTARDASGQNPTLGFHLNGPESTERSFLLTTADARNWGASSIAKPRPSRLKEARDLFT
jgi:hypothetical protein